MSFAKEPIGKGDVVRIQDAFVDQVRATYPDLSKDDVFEVVTVEGVRGKKTMYLKKADRIGLVMLWLRQVKLVKRCGNAPENLRL